MKGNDFVGSMPNSLCFVDELIADCGGIFSCDCCTKCCTDGARCFFNTPPPTRSPTIPPVAPVASNPFVTPAPTFVSTPAPTELPTESAESPAASPIYSPVATAAQDEPDTSCVVSISTDRTCYENGNDIVVTFTNCDETQTDWIGVWQSSESPDNLSVDPLAWVYACGDQLCNEAISSGEAIFYNARGTGEFRMFLLRSDDSNVGPPFTAYASSNEFRLDPTCS